MKRLLAAAIFLMAGAAFARADSADDGAPANSGISAELDSQIMGDDIYALYQTYQDNYPLVAQYHQAIARRLRPKCRN